MSLLENRSLDCGLTATHRKHIFNASLVLVLPELQDKSGFVKNVLGGWEVGTIAQYASGHPFTVFTGAVPGLTNRVSGTGLTGNQRPNVVEGQPCLATSGPPEQILNPDAWTLTGFQLGTFGNSGRGICEGPNFAQVDASLYKNIKLSQRVKAQLRFEVFNVFNRVNFMGSIQPEPDERDLEHRQRRDGHDDHGLHALGELRPGGRDPRSETGAVRDQAHVLTSQGCERSSQPSLPVGLLTGRVAAVTFGQWREGCPRAGA